MTLPWHESQRSPAPLPIVDLLVLILDPIGRVELLYRLLKVVLQRRKEVSVFCPEEKPCPLLSRNQFILVRWKLTGKPPSCQGFDSKERWDQHCPGSPSSPPAPSKPHLPTSSSSSCYFPPPRSWPSCSPHSPPSSWKGWDTHHSSTCKELTCEGRTIIGNSIPVPGLLPSQNAFHRLCKFSTIGRSLP